MISFRRMAGLVGLIIAVLLSVTIGAKQMATSWGLTPAWKIVFAGILPSVVAIAAAVWLERRVGGRGTLIDILIRLGFGSPHSGQIKVGAICLLPIVFAYLVMFHWLHIPSDTVPFLPLMVMKFVIAQGIAEEVVFRGFVFRHLRRGRSFLRAATLSAILFSVVHLANFMHGVTWEILIGVSISMAFTFFVSYPAAYLFERGGNVIWGFSLLHVGIDSINWFSKASEPGLGFGLYLSALIIASLMVFWLGALFCSGPADGKITNPAIGAS